VTQRCGTGTATFCLSGTGTIMHSGSGIEIGPGSNIKCNTKVKNQKLETYFLGNNAASSIEKAKFYSNFLLLKNCAE
jgi:hypothetical protein